MTAIIAKAIAIGAVRKPKAVGSASCAGGTCVLVVV
jgi:hypothetical protein